MNRIVFLVEEKSAKVLIDAIWSRLAPQIAPPPLVLVHEGKRDLDRSIPLKLKAWRTPDDRFLVLRDQDSETDCKALKQKLLDLGAGVSRPFRVRIVCRELEAWLIGDLDAVARAYGIPVAQLRRKRKFRDPDQLNNAKQELKDLTGEPGTVARVRAIAPHMNLAQNNSPSFNAFVRAVREMLT